MLQSASQTRRRDKPVLSCSFCRARKLRCDRQSPCTSCLKRGKPTECIYSSSEQERRDAVDYRPHSRSQQARQRVVRLEKLVTQMRDQMRAIEQSSHQTSSDIVSSSQSSNDPAPPLISQEGAVADSVGRLSLTDDHAVYIGSTHWASIFEDIQGLKDELSDGYLDTHISRESTPFDAGFTTGPSATRISLLSSYPSLPKEQILAMVPTRKVVDRHVSHFFNTFDFASSILHRGIFLTEYSNFWEAPSAASIMWLGLLFSVISVSTFLQQQAVGALGPYSVETPEMLETYRTLTIHCLVAGDYLQPKRYTIETLTLHFAVEQNTNVDTNIGNWILIGVIIRLALRMGLHRDPSHWPSIRPQEAEYRRRLWITLYHMDFFTSTQVGLPRIIQDSQCDSRPPANFFDHDLGLEHNEMPPERPLTDPTSLSHIIQRHTIIMIAAEIYDATEAGPPSPSKIAALSAKLDNAIDSIPEQSKYRSLETSIAENPVTILHRMFIDILINKAVYLLHRRSFMKGSTEDESIESNKLCIDASLAILEHQRRMNEETQPGGIMFGIRWKVASPLNHEFLQATMMLCFALNRFHERHAIPTDSYTLYRRVEILDSLKTAKNLWEKDVSHSVEARRAARAITMVLKQDFDKSSFHNSILSDGENVVPEFNQFGSAGHPALFSEHILGVPQSYLAGFDNTIDETLFSALDGDTATFGSLWGNFVAEPTERN